MDHPQAKDFGAILDKIMAGNVDLPNYKEFDLARGVAAIACGGGLRGGNTISHAKQPGDKSRYGDWARYFLCSTQGGDLDGTGYVITAAFEKGTMVGHVGEFAICKHEIVGSGTREQEMRGWHPGRCKLCNLDVSVDSGD